MDERKVEKVQDIGYFVVDTASYLDTITSYDPRLASQTIIYDWEPVLLHALLEQEEVVQEEQESKGESPV